MKELKDKILNKELTIKYEDFLSLIYIASETKLKINKEKDKSLFSLKEEEINSLQEKAEEIFYKILLSQKTNNKFIKSFIDKEFIESLIVSLKDFPLKTEKDKDLIQDFLSHLNIFLSEVDKDKVSLSNKLINPITYGVLCFDEEFIEETDEKNFNKRLLEFLIAKYNYDIDED